jgi:hypothetical protein
VVVGADNDASPLGEFRSLELTSLTLESATSTTTTGGFALAFEVPAVTGGEVALLVDDVGEVTVGEAGRGDVVALVDEGGGGGGWDVTVSGNAHNDLRSGHAGSGPFGDGGGHVGSRLERVVAAVGERSVGTGSGRSWKRTRKKSQFTLWRKGGGKEDVPPQTS